MKRLIFSSILLLFSIGVLAFCFIDIASKYGRTLLKSKLDNIIHELNELEVSDINYANRQFKCNYEIIFFNKETINQI